MFRVPGFIDARIWKTNQQENPTKINLCIDFLLSKLSFFGVSSMGLRTMVTVNKLSYSACWVRSKDRGYGVAALSLGNSLGYFLFIPKFSEDLFKQNNRIILVIKCEKLNQKSLALYLRREQN